MTGNKGSIPEREPERRLPHPRKAAGAQITQSRVGEVVTRCAGAHGLSEARGCKEPAWDWRASLVPAAAVIPAPVAYVNVVAVKTLVVGGTAGRLAGRLGRLGCGHFEESRVFMAGGSLDETAWYGVGVTELVERARSAGTVGGGGTWQREVKFLDLLETA